MNEHEPSDKELMEKAAAESPGTRRWVESKERRFIDRVMEGADPRTAAEDVGYAPDYGPTLIQRPYIQAELARLTEILAQRTGIEMTKERVLKELDRALAEISAGFSKEIISHGTCPNCEHQVAVTIRAGPREVASLGVAIARTTEVVAKVIGAMAPTKIEHRGKNDEQGTYHTLVRLVKENLHAVSFAQREGMIVNALKDRAAIAELLAILQAEEVNH